MAGVLVFTQLPDGGLDDADKGMLNEGGKIAAQLDLPLLAAWFSGPGETERETPEDLDAYGVQKALALESEQDLRDYPDACAEALVQAATECGARVVLLAHNDQGSALAPGVAHGLGAALWTENVQFVSGEGGLTLSRQALGTRALECRVWDASVPLVLTVNPKRTSPTVLPSMEPSRPAVSRVRVSPREEALRKQVVERVPPDPQTVDVTEAEVIFCAGKGFDPESFAQFQELTRLLNASLGVTRPVYDLGWAGFERMIGQTGKTVAPRFYLGMGISGSMHHVGGIKDSKRLISLNIDPKVPMFPSSDEGFVGDIREVMPRLLDKVKAHLSGAGTRGGAA